MEAKLWLQRCFEKKHLLYILQMWLSQARPVGQIIILCIWSNYIHLKRGVCNIITCWTWVDGDRGSFIHIFQNWWWDEVLWYNIYMKFWMTISPLFRLYLYISNVKWVWRVVIKQSFFIEFYWMSFHDNDLKYPPPHPPTHTPTHTHLESCLSILL